jgi:hypothetical protein
MTERPDAAQRLSDLVTVQQHERVFGSTWTDREWRREVLTRAQQSRDRGLLPTKIDILVRPEEDYLVGRGELLIRAADYASGRTQRLVDDEGLTGAAITELESRVVKLTARVPLSELAAIADRLRRKGVPVAFNFVLPMAVVIKSQGGAEPSARSWPERPATKAATGVRVAVVDTGVTRQERTDGWLAGVAREASGTDPGNIDELFSDPGAGPDDQLLDGAGGHGTAVSGIVQHEAPEVTLAVYRTIPPDGSALESDVAIAMVQAVREGLAAGDKVVLNLSLGTTTTHDEPPIALEAAVDIISDLAAEKPEHDVLIVAAAGNYGTDRIVWPAGFCGVIAVGALTQDGTPAPWSSHGPWVDCSVIGDGVLSVYVEGREDPFFDTAADCFGKDSWALHFGTSFAAPQVAGRIAKLAQEKGIGLRDALGQMLCDTARLPGFGRVLTVQEPIVPDSVRLRTAR